MPYEVNQENPLANIIGLASAYFRVKNVLDQQKQQRDYEQAQMRDMASQQAVRKANIAQTYAGLGDDPQGNPLPAFGGVKQLDWTPRKGESQADVDRRNYITAIGNVTAANAANRPDIAAQWSPIAGSISQELSRYATATTDAARAQEATARTGYIREQTKQLAQHFEQQITLANIRGSNQAQVARIRAAYRSAGGGRSSNTAEQELRAMDAAINEANRAGVDMNNSRALGDYYRLKELSEIAPNLVTPQMQQQLNQGPQLQPYTVRIDQQTGQPIIIQVPATGGAGTRVNNNPPPTPPPKSPPKAAPAAATPPTQSGGNPIVDAVEGILHHLGIGSGSSQHLTAKNRAGQPIHSDDGGKTWQPGP